MSRRVSDTSHSRANSHRPTYSPICQSLKKVHPISVTYLTQVSILLSSSAYYFLRPLTLIQCRHHHILDGQLHLRIHAVIQLDESAIGKEDIAVRAELDPQDRKSVVEGRSV